MEGCCPHPDCVLEATGLAGDLGVQGEGKGRPSRLA